MEVDECRTCQKGHEKEAWLFLLREYFPRLTVMVHEGSGYSYLRCHTQDMNRSTTTDSESVCQDKRRQEEQWIPLRVEYGCTPPELELRLV